ncbi:unnamed protein product [Mytilus edulis]|uniref:Uncharacterized protein n=1 Tax=Mytilus edulis TaxID=6550 RepID=A0A8S3VJY9_MYTED|nr:unnamed protein product [Mytilus edulis]
MKNIETKNTKKQKTTANKLFREYLTEKSKPIEFEQYTVEQLDNTLASFYLEMRSKEGKLYKKTTMQAYRQGLNRHIQKCRDIDICNEDIFKKSCKSYKGMSKELKRLGLAAIKHHSSIKESDIGKMYSYFCKNLEDAQLLQYKNACTQLGKNHSCFSWPRKMRDRKWYDIDDILRTIPIPEAVKGNDSHFKVNDSDWREVMVQLGIKDFV